jgi:hypothetical protein
MRANEPIGAAHARAKGMEIVEKRWGAMFDTDRRVSWSSSELEIDCQARPRPRPFEALVHP